MLEQYKPIIDTIAAIGTLISSFVAAYMIIEVRKQRKSAYKPEVFLDSFCFYILNNPLFLKENELVKYKTTKYNEEKSDLDNSDDYIFVQYTLENLGFGFAKSIECKWEFDHELAIKILKQWLPSDFFIIEEKDYYRITNNKTGFFDLIYFKIHSLQTIDFIQPSVNGENRKRHVFPEVFIKIYMYFHIFKNNLITEKAKNFFHEQFNDLPILKLKLSYRDLTNEVYKKTLKIRMTAATTEFDAIMDGTGELGIFYLTVKE